MTDPAYFAPLVPLPTLIDAPGLYRTRSGEPVQVHEVSARHDFGCSGTYASGAKDHWHKSGRVLAGVETPNDIVARACTP